MLCKAAPSSRSVTSSRCSSRSRRSFTVHAAAEGRQAPSAAVAVLSAAVFASAAFLGGPVVAPAAADEVTAETVVEGPFKGYSGEQLHHSAAHATPTLAAASTSALSHRCRHGGLNVAAVGAMLACAGRCLPAGARPQPRRPTATLPCVTCALCVQTPRRKSLRQQSRRLSRAGPSRRCWRRVRPTRPRTSGRSRTSACCCAAAVNVKEALLRRQAAACPVLAGHTQLRSSVYGVTCLLAALHYRYCYRQAELGIGDCGGLRYIPGMVISAARTQRLFCCSSLQKASTTPAVGASAACLLPGMTKNGKQETPEWLQKVLGVEVPKVEGQGQTLEQLLGPRPE